MRTPRVRARSAPGGVGLRSDLFSKAIGGTLPASLSALIALTGLCARRPASAGRAPVAFVLLLAFPTRAVAIRLPFLARVCAFFVGARVHMCVRAFVCVRVRVRVCACVYVRVRASMRLCVCVSLCVSLCLSKPFVCA